MCPKCKGLLVAMAFPDENDGVMCLSCGRYYYHQEPSEYVREPVVRGSKLGKDVYTTSDPKRD